MFAFKVESKSEIRTRITAPHNRYSPCLSRSNVNIQGTEAKQNHLRATTATAADPQRGPPRPFPHNKLRGHVRRGARSAALGSCWPCAIYQIKINPIRDSNRLHGRYLEQASAVNKFAAGLQIFPVNPSACRAPEISISSFLASVILASIYIFMQTSSALLHPCYLLPEKRLPAMRAEICHVDETALLVRYEISSRMCPIGSKSSNWRVYMKHFYSDQA